VKKAPARIALWMTARGIVFSGLRASEPSVVALSKPTKLNSASTSPKPESAAGHAAEMQLFCIQCQPWRTSRSATTITITVTEAASIHSIRRAEIFTSR
jgi:hypothetical protein